MVAKSHGGKALLNATFSGEVFNEIISMTFVPKKLSVTATQTSFHKTRLRSATLACFSKIPATTSTPYFRQWHIYAIDIVKIQDVSRAEARQVVQELHAFFGKSKLDVITVEEFCAFTGISKNIVRMHLVARQIEHEIKRKNTGNGEWYQLPAKTGTVN